MDNNQSPLSQGNQEASSITKKDITEAVSEGIIESEFTQSAAGLFFVELIIVSTLLGVWQSSWWIGGGIFFALLFMCFYRKTAIFLGVIFSFAWGFLGWLIGAKLIGDIGAGVVIGLVFLMISGGLHARAVDYTSSQ